MKNILITLIALQSILLLTSCEEDDNLHNDSTLLEDAHNYYSFDSGEEDGSQNGIDCDFVGNVSIVPGIKGNAIYINNPANDPFSNDAFVKLPTFDYSQDFTVSFYMKLNFSSADGEPHGTRVWSSGAFFQSGSNLGYDYYLGLHLTSEDNQDIMLHLRSLNSSATTPFDLMPNVRDNNWHHIVIRKQDNSVDFIVDNNVIETMNNVNSILSSQMLESFLGKHQWTDGNSLSSAARFNGLIDEFMLFERALNNNELEELFKFDY